MKVTFTHKNGRKEVMQERFAKILQDLKRGTYMTRDMQAAPAQPVAVQDERPDEAQQGERSAPIDQAIQPADTAPLEVNDGLDDLDVDALRALANERGVKVHHKAGADKLREALRSAA